MCGIASRGSFLLTFLRLCLGGLLCAVLLAACRTSPGCCPSTFAVARLAEGALEPQAFGPPGIFVAPPVSVAAPRLHRCVVEPPTRESPWAVEAAAGLYSIYAWRGFLVTDDPVIQGSVTADYKDLSLNVWGNVDTTDFNGTPWELNEINLTLDYTRAFQLGCVPLAVSVGSIAYLFPVTTTPTLLEFYVGLSADVLLQPSLTVFREVLNQDYFYASLDLGHSFDSCWSELDLGAGVGWGDNAWHRVLHDVGADAFHEFHARAAWNIPRGAFTISPTIWWSSLFRGEVRSAARRADLFVAALVVSCNL